MIPCLLQYIEIEVPIQIFISSKKVVMHVNFCVYCTNYRCLYVLSLLFIATQIKTLVRYLPLAIGCRVSEDDQHWTCFLIFWEICAIALSFEVRKEEALHLGWLTKAFLELFHDLYCEEVNITPKMHQLVHLPQQILR